MCYVSIVYNIHICILNVCSLVLLLLIMLIGYRTEYLILSVSSIYSVAFLIIILSIIITATVNITAEESSMANTDQLTNLHNRRYMDNISLTQFEEDYLYLISIDLDFFKKINDQFGHESGDHILKNISSIIIEFIELYKTAYENLYIEPIRIGGEEILIIVSCDKKLNNKFHIMDFASMLKFQIKSQTFYLGNDNTEVHQTVSMGICFASNFDGDRKTFNLLIKGSDVALYKAKNSGRDTIVQSCLGTQT
jgi:diguanylate cyclase (GGDEF)-like protein